MAKNYDDLVFNPSAYAEISAKKDRKDNGKKKPKSSRYAYYDCYKEGDGFGKLWEAVKDYRNSQDWG